MKLCCSAVKTIKGAVAFLFIIVTICLVLELFYGVGEIFSFGTNCAQDDSYCIYGGVGLGAGVLVSITLMMLRRKMV